MFREVIIPRYDALRKKGHTVTGDWLSQPFPATHDPGLLCLVFCKLIQRGDAVSGNGVYVEYEKDDLTVVTRKDFEYGGKYVDRILTLAYWNNNTKGSEGKKKVDCSRGTTWEWVGRSVCRV